MSDAAFREALTDYANEVSDRSATMQRDGKYRRPSPDELDALTRVLALYAERERDHLAALEQVAEATIRMEQGRQERLYAARPAEAEGDVNMKAIRFDLDRAGIEQRERESVELVELRAKVAELNRYIVRTPRSRAEAEAMVAQFEASVRDLAFAQADDEWTTIPAHRVSASRAALLAALTGGEK